MAYCSIPRTGEHEQHHTKPMWRTFPLSTPSLVSFIVLCLCLLLGHELVFYGCTDGCHVFGKSSGGNVPAASRFVYTQFPTALSMILSLLWIWPHHDIRRLEPYFRMSNPGGEKAGESLFLKYPYEISLFVPFIALKKRHYVVSLSSTILLLMAFLLVPVVANIFDKSFVVGSFPGHGTLSSFDLGRNVSMSSSFSAYNYAWRNGTLAPFMTETYALLPVATDGHSFTKSENWTVETTLFEAELNCTPGAPLSYHYVNKTLQLNITSMGGDHVVKLCDLGAVVQKRIESPLDDHSCDEYDAFITPWTSIDWQFNNSQPMVYMYAWASGNPSYPDFNTITTFPPPINITTAFCTPEYYSQTVNANIAMPAGTVLNVSPTSQRTRIDSLPGFDRMLDGNSRAVPPANQGLILNTTVQLPIKFGYPVDIIANVAPDLQSKFGYNGNLSTQFFGRASLSNIFAVKADCLASFSLFNQSSETLHELLDYSTLVNTTERALKIMFAFAVADIVANATPITPVPLKRNAWEFRVTVNKWWAIGARIGLSTIIILATLLLFLIRRRPCELNGEPHSLAASLRLLSESPDLCGAMRYAEFYNSKILALIMDTNNLFFKLELETVNRTGPVIRVMRGIQYTAEASDLKLLRRPRNPTPVHSTKPWAATLSIALLCYPPFLAVLLIVLYACSLANNGFPMYSSPNSFVSKILYSYLPIYAGTFLGSILTDLGVKQCMMRPYKALETNQARYSKSLAVDYDKYPAHFQLRGAVTNKHYSLAAISVAILLSNVLGIAAAGLFPIVLEADGPQRTHKMLNSFPVARQDMYFELEKALTSNYTTPWTTDKYYIDPPYDIADIDDGEYKTVGFGIDITCRRVPDDRIIFPCSPQFNDFYQPDCTASKWGPARNLMNITDACNDGQPPWPLVWQGSCRDMLAACPDWMIPMWVQNMKFNVTPPGSPTDTPDDFQVVALNCSVTDNIVDLSAKVKDNKVVSVTNVRRVDLTRAVSFYPNNSSPSAYNFSSDFITILSQGIESDRPVLQNHCLARINYLMAKLNPMVVREPHNLIHIPNEPIAEKVFEDVMRRMFALLLKASADDVFSNGTSPVQPTTYRNRVYVNWRSFALSLAIVLFSCGVIIAAYFGQSSSIAGHLPFSVAEMYSQLYASNIKADMVNARGMSLKEIQEQNENLLRKYAYGKYPTSEHYGVYRMETNVSEEPLSENEPQTGDVELQIVHVAHGAS